mgnify:FL=1
MKEFLDRISRFRPSPVRFSSLSEFEKVRKVGSGGFSDVFEAIHLPSSIRYCLKQMDLQQLDSPNYVNIENEIRIHLGLKHRNVVELLDFFFEGNLLFLILEFCSGGNLFKYLNSFELMPEPEIFRVYQEVCIGIAYIHSKRVVQRDIKPENILLNDRRETKICDFGWAIEEDSGEYCCAKAGTCAYMSPQALRGEPQDRKSDIWGLGVLLFELYHNIEPFNGSFVPKQMAVIMSTELKFHPRVGQNARNLILACLSIEPNDRPSIQELLRHPYFVEMNREQINRNKVLSRSTEPQKLQPNFFESKLAKIAAEPQTPSTSTPQPLNTSPPAPTNASTPQPPSSSTAQPLNPPTRPVTAADILAKLRAQRGASKPKTRKQENGAVSVDTSKRLNQSILNRKKPVIPNQPALISTTGLTKTENIYAGRISRPVLPFPPVILNPMSISSRITSDTKVKGHLNKSSFSSTDHLQLKEHREHSNPTSVDRNSKQESLKFAKYIDTISANREKSAVNYIVYGKPDTDHKALRPSIEDPRMGRHKAQKNSFNREMSRNESFEKRSTSLQKPPQDKSKRLFSPAPVMPAERKTAAPAPVNRPTFGYVAKISSANSKNISVEANKIEKESLGNYIGKIGRGSIGPNMAEDSLRDRAQILPIFNTQDKEQRGVTKQVIPLNLYSKESQLGSSQIKKMSRMGPGDIGQ